MSWRVRITIKKQQSFRKQRRCVVQEGAECFLPRVENAIMDKNPETEVRMHLLLTGQMKTPAGIVYITLTMHLICGHLCFSVHKGGAVRQYELPL